MRPRIVIVPLLVVATLFLGTPVAGASISVKSAAKQYLKDVEPANLVLTKFGNEASKWTSQTSDAQAEKEASPVIAALTKLQNLLIVQSWPTKATGDVRTMISAISPLEADLVSLGGLNILGVSNWESTFASNAASLALDVSYVRHDLGLLSTSTAGASISVKSAAKQYLKDVEPANLVLTKFGNEASKWTSQTSDAQAEKEASPVIAALTKLQNLLIVQSWPTKATGDVRTMINAISPLGADLVSIGGLTVLGTNSWESKFASNGATLALDVSYVRHDLGLKLS